MVIAMYRGCNLIRPDRITHETAIPFSAPVGSEPLRTVNGAPLWNVNEEFNCQPPMRRSSEPFCPRKKGNSYTKFPVSR